MTSQLTKPSASRSPSSGPCTAGTAVTVSSPPSGRATTWLVHGARPTGGPPRRPAPLRVVRTRGLDKASSRPLSSRLSGWLSWLTRTRSTGPSSPRATAGPSVLVRYPCGPGGSNVGALTTRSPPRSRTVVGPPTTMTAFSRAATLVRLVVRVGDEDAVHVDAGVGAEHVHDRVAIEQVDVVE